MLQINAVLLNFLFIKWPWTKYHSYHNASWPSDQHIRRISERSCNTGCRNLPLHEKITFKKNYSYFIVKVLSFLIK